MKKETINISFPLQSLSIVWLIAWNLGWGQIYLETFMKDKTPPWPPVYTRTAGLRHTRISPLVGVWPLNYLFPELWLPGALSSMIWGKQGHSTVISMNRPWLNSCQEIGTKGKALHSKGSQSAMKGQKGICHLRWKESFHSCLSPPPPPGGGWQTLGFQAFVSGFQLHSTGRVSPLSWAEPQGEHIWLLLFYSEQQFAF